MLPVNLSPLPLFDFMETHIVGKPAFCRKCNEEMRFTLFIEWFVNGSHHYSWHCNECDTRLMTSGAGCWVDNSTVESRLTPEQAALLPRVNPVFTQRCVVCGDRATENHHWAPRGIFGKECEKWPQDWLCKRHHDEWHQRVTPQLVNPND